MADLDSAAKRSSGHLYAMVFRRPPLPTGTDTAGHRQDRSYRYSGITAAVAVVVQGSTNMPWWEWFDEA